MSMKKPKAPKIEPQEVRISEADRALAETSALRWNDFLTRFAPVQDRFLQLINDMDTPRRYAAGVANAEAMTASGIGPAAVAPQFATGSKTASVRAAGDVADRAQMGRRGLAAAMGEIEPALLERKIRGKLKVAATGRDLQDMADLSTANLGRMSTQSALDRSARDLELKYGIIDAAAGAAGLYAAHRRYGSSSTP